ncbi:MAG: sugar kinase [Rhodoglobus sp.]|nr:sugar kinase [Rhodoglobus sp.]
MKGVVTLGETMMVLAAASVGPLRHAQRLDLSIAGAESNVAIGVARLGVPARWLGRVGDDEAGRLITSILRGEGVDTRSVLDCEAPTGLMLKARRTSHATSVTYYRSGSAGSRLSPADLDDTLFDDAAVLHVTGITPALSESCAAAVAAAVDRAKGAGLSISLDINYRSRLWAASAAAAALAPLVARADLLFAGPEEAALLVAPDVDALSALAALGPSEVVLKRGSLGSRALIDGEFHDVPAFAVDAIDPVGAGDAFSAGYLAARCRGLDPAARLRVASAAGAFAVTSASDWQAGPTWDELDLLDGEDGRVLR